MADDEAQEAIREAYQAYYRRLVATMYGLTADYAEAQDLVQEAYARALARPKNFLDVAEPEAWLRTVAVNLARTRWRRRRLLDTMIRTGQLAPTPESVPGADPTRVLLVAALAKLPRPTRETIVLHHIADMPVQQVADQLGIPVGTVKARLSRGRAVLAELLHEAVPGAGGRSSRPATSADATAEIPPARGAGILPSRAEGAQVVPANAGMDGRGGDNLPHQRGATDRISGEPLADDGTGAGAGGDGLERLFEDDAPPAESLVMVRGRRR